MEEILHTLILQDRYEGFGQRVFGYLTPPISGEYSLELTFSGSIEVWLSPDDQPSNAAKQEFSSTNNIVRLFKRIVFGKIEQVTYVQANLVANKKQYFEIMHTSSDIRVLVVKWRRFDSDKYQPIEPNYLSPYVSDYTSTLVPETYDHFPLHDPSPQMKQFYHPLDERDRTYSLPAVDISAIGDQESWAIPLCQYRPSYTEKGSITNAHDLNLLSTHPYTKLYSRLVEPWVFNAVISSSHKESLIRLFMYHITFTYPNVQLSRFLNMERLADSTNGDLYLIEVLVTVDGLSDREVLISEYVVLGHISLPWLILCQPTAMKMRRDTFVHFLVTHRNFAHMLKGFIRNMERIYIETGDENFGVIIVNYQSADISVASLMQQSKLKHWSIIEIDGPWEKTTAINLGIDSVSNPDDIIFSTDLSIPSYLPDSIRKHTFQGYSGFAPIVFYFACDFSVSSLYKGFYSLNGFGLISLYKSDWLKVGGMDSRRFKGKWGLEDNDFANRIIAKGYVLFRLVMRDFYHQNHTYSGMWEM